MFNRGQTRFWWSHFLLHLHLHLRHCHRHCHHKSSWTLLSDRFFHRTLAPNKEKCPDPLLWRETWTTIVHDWPIPTHHCYMTSCRFNCSSSTVRSSCASCWVFSREEGRESLYIYIYPNYSQAKYRLVGVVSTHLKNYLKPPPSRVHSPTACHFLSDSASQLGFAV